jgi:predicted RND superfamily exporter protein
LERSINFVTEHNRITLLVMLVLTGVMAVGAGQVDLQETAGGTSEDFEDNDRVQKAQYIQDNYGNATQENANRTFQQVYVWKDDGNALSKESLLAGLHYQQEIRNNDSVDAALHEDGIAGIENLVATRAAGDRNASLDAQIAALENTSATQVETLVEQTMSNDPRAQRFVPADHDGSATSTDRRMLVAIDTEADSDALNATDPALYEAAKDRSEAGFFVLNSEAWAEANSKYVTEMMELVLPVALLLILVVLGFAYRDLVDVVVGMAGVVLSILWMFGLIGWLGVEAGTIVIVPLVLVTGLSIDFGFHVFNRYREERGAEDGIREPMHRGVRLVATALVLVTITAAIGFLANLANPLPVIRELGIAITLGVFSALVIFLTVVPALKLSIDGLLERVGLDRRKQPLGHGTYLRPVLERGVTLARRGAPVVLVVAVLVGTIGGLAWMGLSEESYQQPDGEPAEWKQNLPGFLGWDTSEVLTQNQHVEEVYQPASSESAVQSRILVQGDVTSDATLADVDAGVQQIDDEGLLIDRNAERSPVTAMQRVAEENESFGATFQAADSDGDGVPDRNIEQLYDAFYAADSEAAEQVIERTDDGEYRSVLVTLSLTADYTEAESTVPELDDGAERMEANGDRTATAAGSLAVDSAVLGEIIGGIVLTMIVALVAIVLALTAVFKYMHGSATLGAVVSVPILLVVGLVIGGMYILDIPLTLLTALLMSLVIGLGIDYNIHVGDRFADELREGATTIEALNAAVTGTGGALLGSTLTSAGAMATLTLVPQPQLQSFGSIVVIALLTSFLVSVLVLPSVLLLWNRYSGSEVGTSERTEKAVAQD